MILSDRTIRAELEAGRIVIDPLGDNAVQPSSVDLRLERSFLVFRNYTRGLIDVREESEYAEGHIPGAVNIPIRTLADNLDKIPTDQPVMVYCASGHRAAMSTAALQELGYAPSGA